MSAYRDYLLSLNPMLYWALDGPDGLIDLSGHGRDAAPHGGVTIGGGAGPGINGEPNASTVCDGVDDYVSRTLTIPDGPFSVSGWFYRTSPRDHNENIVTMVGAFPLELSEPNHTTEVNLNASGWFELGPSGGQNVWHQFVLTGDGGSVMRLYYDGQATGWGYITLPSSFNGATEFWVSSPGGSQPFTGRIAHWSLFDKQLTPEDVYKLGYAATNGSLPGAAYRSSSAFATYLRSLSPAVYLPLNAEGGIRDQSGNWRDGVTGGSVAVGGFADGPPIVGESDTSTDFDGVDDTTVIPYHPAKTGSTRTFVWWSWADDAATSYLLDTSTSPSAGIARDIFGGSGNLNFSPRAIGSDPISWAGAFPPGAWKFNVLVFDDAANTAELFIDGVSAGVQAETEAWTLPGAIGGAVTRLGGNPASGQSWNGKIAHFAILEYGLSAEQVDRLWNLRNSPPVRSSTEDTALIRDLLVFALEPWMTDDLRTYLQTIGDMFAEVEMFVGDTDEGDYGWEALLNPDLCPVQALPYLAQYVGERLPAGISEPLAREWIKDAPNQLRGTNYAIQRAAQRKLTGNRKVTLIERDTATDHLTVVTYAAETPNASGTLADILSVLPADVQLTHTVVTGEVWSQVQSTWATWAAVKAANATWGVVASQQPAGTVFGRPLP
jgi:hypothetical protein